MTEQLACKRPSLRKRFAGWIADRFYGCGKVVCHVAAAVVAVTAGLELMSLYFPSQIGGALMVLAVFTVSELAVFLLKRILRPILRINIVPLLSLVAAYGFAAFAVKYGAGEGWTWRVFLVTGVILASAFLLVISLWSVFNRGWRWLTGGFACMSFVLSAALILLITGDGFADDTLEHYLALTEHEQESEDAFDSSLRDGQYDVLVLDYGPGEELEPAAVNLASYMVRSDDLTGLYVDAYMEFDLTEVPVRGRVWYPDGAYHCPVLFIAHGNHEITTPSYLGYDYLGEYLASHGYVVVSVDQNACNMLSGENDARAVLLLEHIQQILVYNEREGNPLYGLVDRNNIAIAGHSRGGEMVATAYLFNDYDHYPENAVIRFQYGFSIKSIIAIAPTVNQYKPADHSVALEDVNYLLLHGASDRDVTKFMGMSQYENIDFTGAGDFIKSALYIGGANHGQFNSLWGEYDSTGMESPLLNVESLLPEKDQQTIAKLFVKVFLDVTLLGDESCRSLLTDWEDYAAQLPETVYVQCHEESDFMVIADFEEDSEVTTATMDGASLYAGGVSYWTEELMDFAGSSAYDTHALRLRWNKAANLLIRMPRTDMNDAALTFDICDLDMDSVENGDYDLLNATITLMDANGNTVETQLSDHAIIYPLLMVKTDKLDYLFDTPVKKPAFATVSIHIDEFRAQKGEIDFTKITLIKIAFDEAGEVAIDNIGITYQ